MCPWRFPQCHGTSNLGCRICDHDVCGECALKASDCQSLPTGWTATLDPGSGNTYYVSKTGESTWDRPTEAPTWQQGMYAEHNHMTGKLTMAPDCDGDVKLKWADGSGTSRYIKAVELGPSTLVRWNEERGEAWKPGTCVKKDDAVGRLTTAPDSDNDEVNVEWADGETSGYINLASLLRATQAEWDNAKRAAAPFTHHLHDHQLRLSSSTISWYCDGCRVSGSGARYRCGSGCDYDLCETCKNLDMNPLVIEGYECSDSDDSDEDGVDFRPGRIDVEELSRQISKIGSITRTSKWSALIALLCSIAPMLFLASRSSSGESFRHYTNISQSHPTIVHTYCLVWHLESTFRLHERREAR